MVRILVISGKIVTPGLLNHGFYPWRHHQILSRDLNYIVNLIVWPKFGNSSISMTEVIITSIFWGFVHKNCFLAQIKWFETEARY